MLDCVTVTLVNRVPNSVTVSTGVSGGGTWGTISGTITDQSDLVTYVADEIASIPAPSTPTLDSVTAQGSTTTNAITIGGLTASSLVYPSTDGTTGQIIQTDGSGTLSFVDASSTATSVDLDTVSQNDTTIDFTMDGDSFFYRQSYGDNGTTTPFGRNIFIGKNTGNINVGSTANANYKGSDNIGIGDNNLDQLTDGARNVAIGQGSGGNISSGGSNILLGWGTGGSITTGSENFLLGNFSGNSLSTHKGNVAIGTTALQQGRGFYNIAIGDRALQGSSSPSVGNNVAIGRSSMGSILTGSDSNVGIGSQTLANLGSNADGNIAIGYQAGMSGVGNGASYNILIGYRVEPPSSSDDGQLNIGNLIYGTGLTSDQTLSTGNVGIGTTSPTKTLHVISKSSGDGITISTSQDISVATLYNTNSESFPVGVLSLQYGSNNAGLISGQSNRLNIRGGGSSGGSISFASHTNEMMRLTSSGLGIGTTSPAVSLDVDGQVHLGPQSATGFPSIDIASNGRTTIRASAPALSVRDSNNNGGYIDMGGGTLANINYITSASTLNFSSTNVRYGGDTGARVNVIGQNSSSQYVLGLKQGSSGSNILLSAQDSTGAQVIGITADGGFYARDSNLIKRYVFDHDYAPTASDGLSIGLDFRTENASGVLQSLGYIDVTQDDISADESSMRFSVGETTPTEVMRLQSDGNVGIGSATPSSALSINGTALAQFRLETKGAPSGVSDTNGSEGDFAFDDNYLYIKTANGWGRTQLDFGW